MLRPPVESARRARAGVVRLEHLRELLAVFADTPRFILNAGSAIPATTPGENLRAMIRAVGASA